MNKIRLTYVVIATVLVNTLSFAHNTVEPLRFSALDSIPVSSALPSHCNIDIIDIKWVKALQFSQKEVSQYLNPIINEVSIDAVNHSLNRKYWPIEIIECTKGRFLTYCSTGRWDSKVYIADISEQRSYPVTLLLYHDIALFTYVWYTYSQDTNIIQINYIQELEVYDYPDREELRYYLQTVEEYLLEPNFPYLGKKAEYMYSLPINSIPTGYNPTLPPENHESLPLDDDDFE